MSAQSEIDATPIAKPVSRAGAFWTLLGIFFGASALLMMPSIFYWKVEPFRLTRNEFDFFLGQLRGTFGLDTLELFYLGKCIHFVLFLVVGWCFYKLVAKFADEIEALSTRTLWFLALGAGFIYAIGLPWVSPDVFYYIAKGWMEANYKLDIYTYSLRESPGFPADQMYSNVIPSFALWPGNYGPLHQNICASVAALSGGSVKLALIILKGFNLTLYLATAAITASIAKSQGLQYRRVFLAYALNPLGVFALVTCVHNDALQNAVLILTVLCVVKERPAFSGALLGAALAYKYVAIALVPALILYWATRLNAPRRWRDAGWCLLALLLAIGASHLLYPLSFRNMLVIYSGGWSPIRGSIHFILIPIAELLALPNEVIRQVLTLLFVMVGGAITLWPHFRRRQLAPLDVVFQWFWIFAIYYLTAVAVLEWYLTWILGLGFLLLGRQGLRSVLILSSFYLPLVIFTIRSDVEWPSNLMLFLLMAACLALGAIDAMRRGSILADAVGCGGPVIPAHGSEPQEGSV